MVNTDTLYVKTKLENSIKIGGIYTIHYFKYGRNFNILPEQHNFWELVFIDSGSANILINNTILSLNQSEAFLYKPNTLHTIYTDEKFANSAIISFECKDPVLFNIAENVLIFNDYEKTLLNKIVSETKLHFSDRLNDVYLHKMTKIDSSPFGGEQIIKNCIELLLISLLRNYGNKYTDEDELSININSDRIVFSIKNILTEKLENGENINLDEIAETLKFSKSYIKSQFKKSTGKSVIQYYIDMKIEKAKKLLSQKKYTVSEIADMLGFETVYYFSRLFKIHTHMSPTEYIRSIKIDNVL